MFSLQTPPRRPQFHTPKVEFETPPPPRGMPDLPGPPSSDDEEDDHTPIMQSRDIQGDLTAMKTPRPPGAWMATPAPSRQSAKEPVERASSAPPETEQPSPASDGGLATPPATLSRASSLPPQTPAPPGGWVNTPAPDTTARKRGILKVRFEVESETASEGTIERPSVDSSVESKAPDAILPEASWSVLAPQNGDASTSSAPAGESSTRPPPTPQSLRRRIRQKSPGIRVLDAYGREHVEPPAGHTPDHETPAENTDLPVDSQAVASATPRREHRAAPSTTPRSRSAIRMVDAMGREIEEEPIEDESSVGPPLSRSEALYRIRETLSSMAQDLSEVDRSSDKAVFDARSYASLEERCRTAQVARSKISKSLQMAQMAEVELRSKYAPIKDSAGRDALLPPNAVSRAFVWRLVAGFTLILLIVSAAMYRYSHVQARKIFLTTYYDPFNPELHLYLARPDTYPHTIPLCPSWSVSSVFSSLQRAGLKGVAADAWASASCSVSAYVQSLWFDINYVPDTVTRSWPPT
ncbi:hypothetical protein GY45DRAFT_1345470 [Cubamyces sp. BRFM 1775]|nr:hypothetical protein GY45DRAFT_1345470 [Cubamyces sp. BRFM 1775]